MSSKTVTKEQYKSTDDLKLRKAYMTSIVSTILDFKSACLEYPFRPNIKVLELGSGRGELWNYYFEKDMLQGYKWINY